MKKNIIHTLGLSILAYSQLKYSNNLDIILINALISIIIGIILFAMNNLIEKRILNKIYQIVAYSVGFLIIGIIFSFGLIKGGDNNFGLPVLISSILALHILFGIIYALSRKNRYFNIFMILIGIFGLVIILNDISGPMDENSFKMNLLLNIMIIYVMSPMFFVAYMEYFSYKTKIKIYSPMIYILLYIIFNVIGFMTFIKLDPIFSYLLLSVHIVFPAFINYYIYERISESKKLIKETSALNKNI